MHLMTFVEIAKPNWLECWLMLLAQGVFYNAIRMTGWLRKNIGPHGGNRFVPVDDPEYEFVY